MSIREMFTSKFLRIGQFLVFVVLLLFTRETLAATVTIPTYTYGGTTLAVASEIMAGPTALRISGTDLQNTARIMIIDSTGTCGTTVMSVYVFGLAGPFSVTGVAATAMETGTFSSTSISFTGVYITQPGDYKLCFCAGLADPDCSELSSFDSTVFTFTIAGPTAAVMVDSGGTQSTLAPIAGDEFESV